MTPGAYRLKLWWLFCALLIGVSFVTRLVLLVISFENVDFTLFNVSEIFLGGLFFDAANAIYFTMPLVLYLWLMPDKIFNRSWHRWIIQGLFFILTSILVTNAFAEYLFWDEFNSRFNFIAVDYLVYTTEVIGNINESYPMEWIVAIIILTTLILVFSVRSKLILRSDNFFFKRRSKFVFMYAVLFLVCYFGVSSGYHKFSKNAYVNELAGNGLYELFAAYINNELDYDRFYKRMGDKEAFEIFHSMVKTPEATWVSGVSDGIQRRIVNTGPEKKLNVVLISVESFSAEFMTRFGNKNKITPFLDSLSQHSLFFTNLYATGTRTVRGLEALSLCIPPTPGQSIVRRPKNEHLFSLGKVFNDKGYKCEYIYGGYGYFDNMNYFFGNNEYDVIDRTSLEDEEVHYENIWGVADEDLFTLAERQIDAAAKRQPVFAHVMTTSNHRPFTYPEGRIDIPSHSGRDGAVKYTDYSIGRFIKKCSTKEWFQNTIFIIVADHCASSAGKTDLPVNKYHIPMLIYSPGNIQAGEMDRLMSQIDIGPTLLGMLNFSYNSKFFGFDIFKVAPGKERAFISTYQNLGYLKKGKLVVLSPRKGVASFVLSETYEQGKPVRDDAMVEEAIAWYQSASYSFKNGLLQQDYERLSKVE